MKVLYWSLLVVSAIILSYNSAFLYQKTKPVEGCVGKVAYCTDLRGGFPILFMVDNKGTSVMGALHGFAEDDIDVWYLFLNIIIYVFVINKIKLTVVK